MGKRSRKQGGHPASDPRASGSHEGKWERLARENGWDAEEAERRQERDDSLVSAMVELETAARMVAFFASRRLEGGSAMPDGASDEEGRERALEEFESRLDDFRAQLAAADELSGGGA